VDSLAGILSTLLAFGLGGMLAHSLRGCTGRLDNAGRYSLALWLAARRVARYGCGCI
jgi:hypothetical protein